MTGQELDHTVVTILSKTSDTNHFIRDDAIKTLEAMIQNVPPQKALAVLIANGTGYDRDFYTCGLVLKASKQVSSFSQCTVSQNCCQK